MHIASPRRNAFLSNIAFCAFAALMLIVGVTGYVWVGRSHVDYAATSGLERDEVPDYVSFYAAAKMVRQAAGDRLYDVDAVLYMEREVTGSPIAQDHVLPYFNPPFLAALLAPLTLLSLPGFGAALGAMNLALLLVCALDMQKLLKLDEPRHRIFFWLALLSSVPMVNVFLQHQVTLWVMVAWLGFVVAQMQGRQKWSGVVLALGLVKPHMVVLPVLFLVYRRQWRALVSFGAVAATFALVSVLVAGPAVLVEYPRFLLQSTGWEANGIKPYLMYGWNGLLVDALDDPTPSRWLFGGLCLVTLGTVAVAWKRITATGASYPAAAMAVALMASLLVSAHLYLHDVALAGLAIVVAAAATGSARTWGWVAAALWLTALPWPLFSYAHGLPLLSLALVALFALIVQSVVKPDASASLPDATSERLAA
jgi:hypothetical protein